PPNPFPQSLPKHQPLHITSIQSFIPPLIPPIISLILLPLIIYKIYPPQIKQTPNPKSSPQNHLKHIPKIPTTQKFILSIFLLALAL
ncbi:anion permease, partial [Staphylococcus saprophyticus]|uniref:anion permease n=1 Tax=Staphylococcus saprophyticus TaxID=29385 RepID=UPI001642CF49